MIKFSPKYILIIIKNFFLIIIFYILDKKRFTINNHKKSSREITIIRQYSEYQEPNSYLLEFTSILYKDYVNFCKIYKSPSANFSKENVWKQYPIYKTGEHYALLPLIINNFKAKNVIEIGTFMGCSAKSILLNTNSKIITFDVIPYQKFKNSFLEKKDFSSGRITQKISDLSIRSNFNSNVKDLLDAEVIFIDGPKNKKFELSFLNYLFNEFKSTKVRKNKLIILDDVKVSTMVEIWHSIPFPKIIIDGIGHWSGTGLVLLKNDLL